MSVLSPTLQIEIINPCLRTVVNGDEGFEIEYIDVPAGKNVLETILAGPRDTTSITYGNGYDRCGDLTYLWIDSNGDEF